MLFLIQFPCKLWKSSLKRTCFKQNFNSWTFSNFFSNYYVKILMRYNIQNKILDRKIALFVFKLREQLFELREEYRKNDIEWFFFIKLSLGKLLGKDNVGGNEALRVNLLSNTQSPVRNRFSKEERTDLCWMKLFCQCTVYRGELPQRKRN